MYIEGRNDLGHFHKAGVWETDAERHIAKYKKRTTFKGQFKCLSSFLSV
jgi:hypothetical protein